MLKLKNMALVVGIVLAGLLVGEAQITIPHTFTTTVPVAQLNTNLSTLGSGALNRANGTITGNITVNGGVTIDGVDISAALGTAGDLDVDSINLRNTGATAVDIAGGITAGSGNVGIVGTDGRIPAISSTYFANLSGANLTGLTGSQFTTTGTNVAHAGGNFTAGGSMTWTVSVGDQVTFRYYEFGKQMTIILDIRNATTGGTASSSLMIATPNSRSCSYGQGSFQYNDAGTAGTGWYQVSGTTITLYKSIATPNWTLGTDNNFVIGTLWCEFA